MHWQSPKMNTVIVYLFFLATLLANGLCSKLDGTPLLELNLDLSNAGIDVNLGVNVNIKLPEISIDIPGGDHNGNGGNGNGGNGNGGGNGGNGNGGGNGGNGNGGGNGGNGTGNGNGGNGNGGGNGGNGNGGGDGTGCCGNYPFNEIKLSDLPDNVTIEIIEALATNSIKYKGPCKSILTTVQYLLFNVEHPDEPVILNTTNLNEVDSTKEVKVLVHGAHIIPTLSEILSLKDALIKRHKCNVIVLNWSELAFRSLTEIFYNLQDVATKLGNFLYVLKQHRGISLGKIHLIGQGAGAHLCGIAGKVVKGKCGGKIDRITGLSPTGLLFQDVDEDLRLDKYDANFVDVIFVVSVGIYKGPLGSVNIYINCGCDLFQVSCIDITSIGIGRITQVPLATVECTSILGWKIYCNTVLDSKKYTAWVCPCCPDKCEVTIFNKIIIGDNCPRNPPHNKYVTYLSKL